MATIIYPIVVAVLGLIMFLGAAKSPNLIKIGWALFCVGLFWTVYLLTDKTFRL